LAVLLPHIEKDVNITYYVINKAGDLRTNTHSEGPNAVTWGVFPGKEIVQPTIVEAISFMAWKDEAYELGQQWGSIYDPGSAASDFVKSFFDTSLLVNVVHNDFRQSDAIFEPFIKAAADYAAQKHVPNGRANGHANGDAVIPNGHAH
jgi:methylenetetrahydrofolate reductase (NADPH)